MTAYGLHHVELDPSTLVDHNGNPWDTRQRREDALARMPVDGLLGTATPGAEGPSSFSASLGRPVGGQPGRVPDFIDPSQTFIPQQNRTGIIIYKNGLFLRT